MLRKIFPLVAISFLASAAFAAEPARVSLSVESSHPGVIWAAGEAATALKERGLPVERADPTGEAGRGPRVVVGLLSSEEMRSALEEVDAGAGPLPSEPESILVACGSRRGRATLAAGGPDARGTMYAALELSERLRALPAGADPFSSIGPVRKSPDVKLRGVNLYWCVEDISYLRDLEYFRGATYSRERQDALIRQIEAARPPAAWFGSEEFWRDYLKVLARCRFNWIDLHAIWTYNFENAFTHVLEAPSFPGVRAATPEKLRENLKALRTAARLCAEMNIDLCFHNQAHFVPGLSQADTERYTAECVTALLKECPEIAALGIRVAESGQGEEFYTKTYPDAVRGSGRIVPAVVRTWGARRAKLEEFAARYPGPVFVEIKFNGEHQGYPYQAITNSGRGQSYSYQDFGGDVPRAYAGIIWQMRVHGDTRLLRWGDPDFLRRFAASCHFEGASGFSAELVSGMYLHTDWYHHPGSGHEFIRWDTDRDWLWYLLYGRLTYDRKEPAETWLAEFRRRFGDAGEAACRSISAASKIVPLYYGLCCRSYDWGEVSPELEVEDLDSVARTKPLDVWTTYQIEGKPTRKSLPSFCDDYLAGQFTAKLTPFDIAGALDLYARKADDAAGEAVRAAAREAGGKTSPELECLLSDARALARFGRARSETFQAATHLALYRRTGDLLSLQKALAHARAGREEWRLLSDITSGHYRDFPDSNWGRSIAHWRLMLPEFDRLVSLVRDEEGKFAKLASEAKALAIRHTPLRKARPCRALPITATVAAKGGGRLEVDAKPPRGRALVRYRLNEGTPREIPMVRSYRDNGGLILEAIIPQAELAEGILEYVILAEKDGESAAFPAGAGEGMKEAIRAVISEDRDPPRIEHLSVERMEIGKPVPIRAKVSDPSGISAVRLFYRRLPTDQDFEWVEMRPAGDAYSAEIPAEFATEQCAAYFLEAVDKAGNGAFFPDVARSAPPDPLDGPSSAAVYVRAPDPATAAPFIAIHTRELPAERGFGK